MSEPVTVDESTFEQTVLQAKTPVLVDFWAPWCRPCQMVAPVLEELAKDYEGKITVAKLNVDQNAKTASKYGVMSIPTLLLFKDGAPVDTVVGAVRERSLASRIDGIL